jgi:transcription elongation GreA/GreB family factor
MHNCALAVSSAFRYPMGGHMMTMLPAAVAPAARQRWSMTRDALDSLRADAVRLAEEADRSGGYAAAHLAGEADAPTLVPNVEGQRLVRQLQSARSVLSVARVETDGRLAVIGRRVTLEGSDGSRTSYTLVIPGQGDPARGWVSADSPVGRAIYARGTGDEVDVEAPDGTWTATIVSVE